jgi:hypothetical protein
MSTCIGEITKLSERCAQNTYPYSYTNLEPLKWNRLTTEWDNDTYDDPVPLVRCFYLDDVLQFRHVMEYDAEGNEISLSVE